MRRQVAPEGQLGSSSHPIDAVLVGHGPHLIYPSIRCKGTRTDGGVRIVLTGISPHRERRLSVSDDQAPSKGGHRRLRLAMVNDIAGVASSEVAILRNAGAHVDYFSLGRLGAGWPRLWKLLALPVRLLTYVPAVIRLRRGRYDVIHIHFVSQGIVGLATGRPFVLHAHGSDLHLNFQRRWMRLTGRYLLGRASLIIYVTPNLREYLRDFSGKSRLIGNPVESRPLSRPRGSISRALIFARLEPIKGVDVIFDGIDEITKEVDVTVISWGPWAEDYRRRFGHVVTFIPPVAHARIPSLLDRFDVVIGQMRQGILGLSELEAMATGKPVLTNLDASLYADDPPPVIQVRNAAEIATALRRLATAPEEVTDLAQRAHHWVERNHGSSRHRELLLEAYASVLGAAFAEQQESNHRRLTSSLDGSRDQGRTP